MRVFLLALVSLVVLVPLSTDTSHAQTCTFVLGFKALRDQIPDIVGSCLEDEHRNAETGNVEQHTANGLLIWRESDSVTELQTGNTTWLNGPRGLQNRPTAGPPFSWETVVLVGAGDIASCSFPASEGTAKLLDDVVAAHPAAVVFTLGDNAYDAGTREEFHDCYGRWWGQHKKRTRPSPGNHDYATEDAAPYFEYFNDDTSAESDSRAGPSGRGYYSFDVGSWHIVSLNSERGFGEDSDQAQWLEDDLTDAAARGMGACTLAYWHKPLVSSGSVHGDEPNRPSMRAFWRTLHRFGAEIVLNGHDHIYERFNPGNPNGGADPEHGIRQFIVGTGGMGFHGFGTVKPNSAVRVSEVHGVLQLTLKVNGYAWRFTTTDGERDSGTDGCH